MTKKKVIGGFIGSFIIVFSIIAFSIAINERIKLNRFLTEQEPEKQDFVFLTFDQRVAHMKKCFNAAEKITTLAWSESTGSITVQLYLDTIDDLSEEKNIILGPHLKLVQEELKNE